MSLGSSRASSTSSASKREHEIRKGSLDDSCRLFLESLQGDEAGVENAQLASPKSPAKSAVKASPASVDSLQVPHPSMLYKYM